MSKIRPYKNYSIYTDIKRFFDECNNEFRFVWKQDYWEVFLKKPWEEEEVFQGKLPWNIRGIKEGCRNLLKRFDEL